MLNPESINPPNRPEGSGNPPGSGNYGPGNYSPGNYSPGGLPPAAGYGAVNQGAVNQGAVNYGAVNQGAGGGRPPGKSLATDAIVYGWRQFTANPLPWLIIALIQGVIVVAAYLILVAPLLLELSKTDPEQISRGNLDLSVSFSGLAVIIALLAFVASFYLNLARVRGSLLEVDGTRPTLEQFFRIPNLGMTIVVALVVAIAVAIATIISFGILGIVVVFLSFYAITVAIDRRAGLWQSLRGSFRVITANFGQFLLLAILLAAISWLGGMLIVGSLITLPVTSIAASYAYRVASAGPVAYPAGPAER